MSRTQIVASYQRILGQWPKDILRPENDFRALIQKRIDAPPIPFRKEENEVRAAQQLLDNTFSKRAKLQPKLLKPASNPDHYENLRRELEEMPTRTWFQNTMKRLSNMVRFS